MEHAISYKTEIKLENMELQNVILKESHFKYDDKNIKYPGIFGMPCLIPYI